MSNFQYTNMTDDMINALNYLNTLYVNNKYNNTEQFLSYIRQLVLPQEFINDKKNKKKIERKLIITTYNF